MSSHPPKRVCPVHHVKLERGKTKYEYRYDCPYDDCDIMCWGTSAPADQATRSARIKAHATFDPIWKEKLVPRKQLYSQLSEFMDLSKRQCHISLFSEGQCGLVLVFCKGLSA